MQKYKITTPDGQQIVVEAESPEAAVEMARAPAPQQPNTNPGVDPSAPPEMFLNPNTGQYTSRELLANNMAPGGAESAATGAYQGLSFGGGDEVMGGINAAVPGPGSASERYTFGREHMRSREEAARRDHPYLTGAGEIGGGVATALTYGLPAASRMGLSGLPGAMAANAAVGGAEGVTYGALSGEGARDRIAKALGYGMVGTGVGAATPLATSAAKGLWHLGEDVVAGGVDAAVGKGRQSKAHRAVAATLNRSGKTPQEVNDELLRAAQEGQPEYRLMDALGRAGQRRASGITRAGGDASEEISDFLLQRQRDQADRVGAAVNDAFDLGGSTARATRNTVKAGRDAAADINFGNIRSNGNPVDVRDAVSLLDDKISTFEGAGIEGEAMSALKSLRGRLAGEGADGASYELSDFNKVFAIRKQLRDDISALYRQGRNEAASELKAVRAALDDALAESSDQYRAAMDEFAASSRVMDAVESGQKGAMPGQRAGDTIDEFSALSPDERAAYRVGYGDKVAGRVEGATEGTNAANQFSKTKVRNEAGAIAIDPELLARRMGREQTMNETMRRATGGSLTADNQQDIADLAGFDAAILGNLLAGRPIEATRNALARGGSVLTGASPETRKIIARALMSNNADPLNAALRQARTSEQRREVMDALVRILAQKQASPALVNQ